MDTQTTDPWAWTTDTSTATTSGNTYVVQLKVTKWNPYEVHRKAMRRVKAELCLTGRAPIVVSQLRARHGFQQLARLPGYRKVRVR